MSPPKTRTNYMASIMDYILWIGPGSISLVSGLTLISNSHLRVNIFERELLSGTRSNKFPRPCCPAPENSSILEVHQIR